MKIQGIRTRYGAKQPLHEVFGRLPSENLSSVVISYGHPGWHQDETGGQSRDESDSIMDEFYEDPNIRDVFIEDRYAYTKWENGSFSRYLKNLAFSESYLIWIPVRNQGNDSYLFHKKNWEFAIFAYEGMLFYEIFYRTGSVQKVDGDKEIEYPGDINGPGGIGMAT